MQQNATRPVMDVARRSSSVQTARMAVRPAPERAQSVKPRQSPEVREKIPASPAQTAKNKTFKENPISTKSSVPVGIIVVALLAMMVLIALAVIIYLTA